MRTQAPDNLGNNSWIDKENHEVLCAFIMSETPSRWTSLVTDKGNIVPCLKFLNDNQERTAP